MRHESMVAAIVSAQLALLVGETEIADEQLGVAEKQVSKGVAPAVNDPCMRKGPVDDSEMQKIVEILIDDSSGARRKAPQSLEG